MVQNTRGSGRKSRIRATLVELAIAVCVLTTLADLALGQAKLGDPDYRFKIGDRIRVTVPDRPAMNKEAVISQNGTVTVALVGEVIVEGLTTLEIHEKLFQALHDYYPSLTKSDFTVEGVPAVVVYVTGAVSAPGRYTFAKPPNLWQAIREAGGPTGEAALDVVRIVKDESKGGETKTINVLSTIEQGTTDELPVLDDGDTVVLLSTREIYVGSFGVSVLGAVVKPGFYRLQGEHVDVMSALVLAGGALPRASLGGLKIIRVQEDGSTVAEKVNLGEYIKTGDPKLNPSLKPGDTVVVPEQNAWAYQFKNNFGLILGLITTAATVFLVWDRIVNE
jgi:polysaccharide export outer membrane protein